MGSPFHGEAAMSPASAYAGGCRARKVFQKHYAAAMASISIMKSAPYSFDTSTSVTAGAAGGARGDAGRSVKAVWRRFPDRDRGHRSGIMLLKHLARAAAAGVG